MTGSSTTYKIKVLKYTNTEDVFELDFPQVSDVLRFTEDLLIGRYGYIKGTIYNIGWDIADNGLDELYYVEINPKTKVETKIARITTRFNWR